MLTSRGDILKSFFCLSEIFGIFWIVMQIYFLLTTFQMHHSLGNWQNVWNIFWIRHKYDHQLFFNLSGFSFVMDKWILRKCYSLFPKGTTKIKESSTFKLKKCCAFRSNQFNYTLGQVSFVLYYHLNHIYLLFIITIKFVFVF